MSEVEWMDACIEIFFFKIALVPVIDDSGGILLQFDAVEPSGYSLLVLHKKGVASNTRSYKRRE